MAYDTPRPRSFRRSGIERPGLNVVSRALDCGNGGGAVGREPFPPNPDRIEGRVGVFLYVIAPGAWNLLAMEDRQSIRAVDLDLREPFIDIVCDPDLEGSSVWADDIDE